MSYILDALQRADAERARGGVPTLHARPLGSPPLTTGFGPKQRIGLVVGAVVVLSAAVAGWWIWGSAPAPASSTVVIAASQQPIAPLAVAPLAPLAAQALPPTSVAAVATVAPPQPAVAMPTTAAPAPPGSKATPVAAVKPPSEAVPVAPTPSLAPLLGELPEATRRQIPAMAITGAVYSDNPAQRLLLVNGLVLNQGAQVAPDLTLVEIRSNSSEFSFRGTRFRMAH